jgi:hypothetical protein
LTLVAADHDKATAPSVNTAPPPIAIVGVNAPVDVISSVARHPALIAAGIVIVAFAVKLMMPVIS